ncbi:hypothetical protein ADS79_26645 [Brevibacillus reuszeri]|uniref:Uncharacterized protein n=1 Tax=Brevibacillus reuszeri TaxID=54915 RepID=A0A0K9YL39_9BACL|nr:hypothetical protein ADS79_26645 [Brevibacillus reuszeri]
MAIIFRLNKCSYGLAMMSVLICLSDYWGSTLANIVLVRLNPVIDMIIFKEPFTNWMVDAESTKWVESSVFISLQFPAYLIHFGTFLLAGLVIDYFINMFRAKQSVV